MKKAVALLLVFTMLFVDFAYGIANGIDFGITANAATSGTCGENLTWTLDGSGTLTISGTGKMADYSTSSSLAPWYDSRSDIKTVVINSGVTNIGELAFYYCNCLSTITIPSSITSIGSGAFARCVSLTSATIPSSVTSIGDQAFYYCTSLTSISIPSSVTSIGKAAFSRCSSLTNVAIPPSITNIEEGAFMGCSSFTDITIPSSVISIGKAAFSGCSSLTSITIPSSVTSIGNIAFQECSSLTSVTLPSSVSCISDYSFDQCTSLTNITIPASVKSVGEHAFNRCYSLTNVTIPSSVTSIGSSAFSICNKLSDVYYSGTKEEWYKVYIGSDNNYLVAATLHCAGTTYTISYNANGGSGVPSTQTKTYGTALTLSSTKPTGKSYSITYNANGGSGAPAAQKYSYTFKNWNTKQDGSGSPYSAGETYTLNADATLYAQWTAPSTPIISSTKPTRTGYIFDNWNTKTDGTGTKYASGSTYTSATNVTLYAIWKPITYTVKYDANGGSGTMSSVTHTYGAAKNLTANAFTKTGSGFSGWNTAKDGSGKSYTDKQSVTNLTATNNGIVTLYAQWTQTKYTVTFNANGHGTAPANQTVAYGGTASKPTNPTATGWTFGGWYKEAACTNAFDFTTQIKGNTTLYAKWTQTKYTVTFNANGHGTAPASQTVAYGATVSKPTNPTATGWTFGGWYKEAACTNAFDFTTQIKGNTTLYAKWTTTNGRTLTRLAGDGRQATAAAISKQLGYTSGNVVLASGDNYADALAGVPLAYTLNAPILLVRNSKLDKDTLNEITRLKAKNVYILGGTSAVGANVESELKKSGYKVERISGNTRFETAVQIAEKIDQIMMGTKPSAAFFVYSHNYPDALAISGIAARMGPILYIGKDGVLDPATKAYLEKCNISDAVRIIGGPAVISGNAENSISSCNVSRDNITRIYGADRYETCDRINAAFPSIMSAKSVCLATGTNFPDALAGGVLSAKTQSPMILVGTSLTDSQKAFLKSRKPNQIFVFGGTGAVSDKVANDAVNAAK